MVIAAAVTVAVTALFNSNLVVNGDINGDRVIIT